MKLTLLELTQNILSSLDGEEVNSISDTAESRQVSQIIRNAYYNIFSRANLPEHNKPFSLDASADSTLPVLMYRPSNVARIDWIKYNISDDSEDMFSYVTILPVQQFLDSTQALKTSEDNVDTLTLDSHTYYFNTDRAPSQCTVIKDYYILFNSFDSDVEATLQTSKTFCSGLIVPEFSLVDSFIPEIDEQQFMLLFNEAKSLAFSELKQITHEQAVIESRRQWRTLQKNKDVNKPSYFDQLPSFGRK